MPRELEILPAEITITANDEEITYGEFPQTSGTITGIQYDDNGDDLFIDGVQYFADCGFCDVAGSPHTITPNTSLSTGNYTLNFVSGELTVNPFDVTVTVDDATIEYGDEGPFGFTVSYSPNPLTFPFEESPIDVFTPFEFGPADGCTEATTIDITNPSFPTNYNPTYVSGNLTINPATLTIAIEETSLTTPAALPVTPIFTTSGLLCGEASPTAADFIFTILDDGTPVSGTTIDPGIYEITAEFADPSGTYRNYDLSVEGNLLIVNDFVDCAGEEFIDVFIDCADPFSSGSNPNITKIVTLGYENPTASTLYVPNGINNQFIGTAFVDGTPPEEFLPGLNFFDVLIGDGTFRWELLTPSCVDFFLTQDVGSALFCGETIGQLQVPDDFGRTANAENADWEVQLSPNPVRQQLMLKTSGMTGNYQVELYNSVGQLIQNGTYNTDESSDVRFDVQNVSSGILVMKVSYQSQVKVYKVIKQ